MFSLIIAMIFLIAALWSFNRKNVFTAAWFQIGFPLDRENRMGKSIIYLFKLLKKTIAELAGQSQKLLKTIYVMKVNGIARTSQPPKIRSPGFQYGQLTYT